MFPVLTAGILLTLGLHAWLGLAHCCGVTHQRQASASLTHLAAQPQHHTLSVLTLYTDGDRSRHNRLRTYLTTAGADVVVLSGLSAAQASLLEDLKPFYPYQVRCRHDPACSLALLSRLPLDGFGTARLGADQPAFVWARLPDGLTIVGTRLQPAIRGPWRHEHDMAALAELIRRLDGPVILAGALNTSPWSGAYRLLRRETALTPTSVLLPSWPARPFAFPQIALDHILVSQELAVAAAGTGPAAGSDHLSVWARLERRGSSDPPRSATSRFASGPAAPGAHLGPQLLADLGREHTGARDLRR
jgi:endonuclease/exonuclease/phosphatase (EEP) superfamily protein YafD